MLGKLIKHEFIADSRVLVPSYIAVLIISLVGKLVTWIATRQKLMDSLSYSFMNILQWVSSLLSIIYFLVFIAVIFLTIFYVIYRFYKNYFTDEGYMMLTLPSRTVSLVSAKFLTAVIWLIIGGAVSVLSIYLTLGGVETIQNLWEQLKETISLILTTNAQLFEDYLGVSTGVFVFEVVVVAVMYGAKFVVEWYFSIAFGQLISKNHKILGAILSFLAIDIVTLFLISLFLNAETSLLSHFITDINSNIGHAMQAIVIGAGVYYMLIAAVLFLLTCRIMNRHLNLD